MKLVAQLYDLFHCFLDLFGDHYFTTHNKNCSNIIALISVKFCVLIGNGPQTTHILTQELCLPYIRVPTSAGTLLWIYRRLIGRSYIALARQDQYIGNISDPLGRLRS